MHPSRQMWTLYEPVHALSYFHPRARAAFEAAGLRGFWRGYFAGRAAPLGPVAAPVVVAAFFGFAPPMVARALPGVWELADPERSLAARQAAAVDALTEVLGPDADVAEAADLLTEAGAGLDHAGRVLGAANAALPVPAEPLARLWQAATLLREHRGDGHVAALVAAGMGGCEVQAWRSSHDLSRDFLQPARGWTDEQWQAAAERLTARGWLDAEARPTTVGIEAFQEIERVTDEAAAGPWRNLGPAKTARLREVLTPIARACHAVLPAANPIGLPHPRSDATDATNALRLVHPL